MLYRSIAPILLYFGIWQPSEHEKQECFTEVLRHSCPTSVFGWPQSMKSKNALPKYCTIPALLRYLAALRAQKARSQYRSIAPFLPYFGIWQPSEHKKQDRSTEVLRHSCPTSVFGSPPSTKSKIAVPKYCDIPALLQYLAALRAQKARSQYRSIAPILLYFGIRLATEHEKQECFTEVLRHSCSTSVFGSPPSTKSKIAVPKYCATPALLRYLATLRAQKARSQYRSIAPFLPYFGIRQASRQQ